MAQKEQLATVNLNKLYLTQQEFKHLWKQALDLFLHSCNESFFLFCKTRLEVFSTTVEDRFPQEDYGIFFIS